MSTPDSQEELIAFADETTLGAEAPDESSLILKLQAITEKILFWFDINQLTLNVKKSYLLIFSRKGVSSPTITEPSYTKRLHKSSPGSICAIPGISFE